MKEVDNINAVDDGLENEVDLSSQYNKLNDGSSKLKFLVDVQKRFNMKKEAKQAVSEKEITEFNNLNDDFKQTYIRPGNKEVIKPILDTLNRLNVENDHECFLEFKKALKELPKGTRKENEDITAMFLLSTREPAMGHIAIKDITWDILNVISHTPKTKIETMDLVNWRNETRKAFFEEKKLKKSEINAVEKLSEFNFSDKKQFKYVGKVFTPLYEQLTDIPSRLKFLVDARKTITARNMTDVNVPDAEIDELSELIDSFTDKYITKGSPETIKLVMETMGDIGAENNYDCYRENAMEMKYSSVDEKDLPKDPKQREKVRKWLLDQTGVGMESFAINAVNSAIQMALNGDDRIENKLFKAANITKKTTMKEYALKCGVDKSRVEEFLQNKKTSANEKVYDYFNRIDPKAGKLIDSNIKGDLVKESGKAWMRSGAEAYYKKNGVVGEKRKAVDEVAKKNHSEYSFQSLKDWPEKVGEKYVKNRRKREAENILKTVDERYKKGLKRQDKSDLLIDELRMGYIKAETMEAKFDFIVEACTKDEMRDKLYGNQSEATSFIDKIIKDFANTYITKADIETQKKLFSMLGRKTAENLVDLMKEDATYRTEFQAEGKLGVKKADALAWRSVVGAKAQMLTNISKQLNGSLTSYANPPAATKELFKKSGLTLDSSIEEYLSKTGKTEEEIAYYLQKNNIAPGTKVIDSLVTKNNRNDKVAALDELELNYYNAFYNSCVREGSEPIINQFGEQEKNMMVELREKLDTELSFSGGAGEWLDGEGKKRYKDQLEATASLHLSKDIPVDKKVKSFDNYIKLHTGWDVYHSDINHQKDCLIKAVAANSLKNCGYEFKVDRIHKLADIMKQNNAEFDKIFENKETIRRALSSPENLAKTAVEFFGEPYKVNYFNVEKYLDDMNKLSKSMMSSEGRSKEYQAYANAVKRVADLKAKYDLSLDRDKTACAEELVGLNMDLVTSVQNYMGDKMKVRSTTNGKARFDNALDALAIVSQNMPKLRGFVSRTIDDINKARGAKAGSEKFVGIEAYGAARAVEAKQKREPKPQAKKAEVKANQPGLNAK
ncbi:MAG: hypothetical protein IKQ71_00835 [Lachnospiraceae bacterium]|nr:hypothetical protein [Lachnospiraceae bacterium]